MSVVIPLPRSEELHRQQLRAVLYGRASRDRHKRGRSIRDQFAVGEVECAERGWQIVDRYEDRDRSATRRATKVRERFEEMIADAETGKFDVIVYAESSRVSRNLNVSLTIRDLCVRTGILLCYNGRVYNMRIAGDFKEFTRDAVQAEEEGEVIIVRNERTARLTAKRGGVWATCPFGYKRQYDPDTGELLGYDPETDEYLGQVAHPEEYPVLQDLFERADARQSLASLVPLVRPFRPDIGPAGIRTILRNRAYIGIRVHHDAEYKAMWPALVEEALFWRVQALLDEPERRTSHSSGVQHLLTGIALCVDCRAERAFTQAKMKAKPAQPKYRRGPQYLCRVNHLSIMEVILDAYVEEAVLDWISSPRAQAVFRRGDSSSEIAQEQARHAAMLAQLTEAREQAATFDPVTGMPGLSAVSLAALEQRILPLLAQSNTRARKLLSAGDPLVDRLLNVHPDELDAIWSDELTLEQRRHVVRRIVRVEVRRALSQGRGQPVGPRVALIFAGEPGFDTWPEPVQ